jgi:hypothetical protein
MKTTVDLPDELLHRVKVAAAQRQITLKEMILRGLQHELAAAIPAGEETDALIEALSKGRNTKPTGHLNREELYDRTVLRRH